MSQELQINIENQKMSENDLNQGKKQKKVNSNQNPIIQKLREKPQRLTWFQDSLQQFTMIKKNQYLDRKRKAINHEYDPCTCEKVDPNLLNDSSFRQDMKQSYNCGESCLNQIMCTECYDDNCASEEFCQNRRFQQHQDACVYPFPCGDKGWGLAAGQFIKKDRFVMQYIGEMFSINTVVGKDRCKRYSDSRCTYMMKINNHEVIDPTDKGNLARFMNHSCQPNCKTLKWNVLGQIVIGIFAVRDIKEDDELSFDYHFDSYRTPLTKCLCGTQSCRGYLGYRPQGITMEKWQEILEQLPCSICNTNTEDDDDKLLLCDDCNRGFHIFCLSPPITEIPQQAWFCNECQEQSTNVDIEEVQKKKNENLKEKQIKTLKSARVIVKESDSDDDSGKEDPGYEEYYNFSQKLEVAAIDQLYEINEDEENQKEVLTSQRISKKQLKKSSTSKEPQFDIDKSPILQPASSSMQIEENKTSENQSETLKSKTAAALAHQRELNMINRRNDNSGNEDEMRRRNEQLQMTKKLDVRFQDYLKINPLEDLNLEAQESENQENQKMEEQESPTQAKDVREELKINKLEMIIIKSNLKFFVINGVKTFWDASRTCVNNNLFIQNIEFTISGIQNRVIIFQKRLEAVSFVVENFKQQLGIMDAKISIPALFIQRIMSPNQVPNMAQLQQELGVTIKFQQQHLVDQLYPLDLKSYLLVKGTKENILKLHNIIKQKIKTIEVYRMMISASDTYCILKDIQEFKQKLTRAEFRIARDHLFQQVNHPFYYLKYQDKELVLIGTQQEIQWTKNEIKNEINRKRQYEEYLTSNFLLPFPMRKEAQAVKLMSESMFSNASGLLKINIYDPVHPRKNLTFSITGSKQVRTQIKEMLQKAIDQQTKQERQQFYIFQDQMMYQMTKHFFKYMQNSFLTNDTSFMKNWDILSPYIFSDQLNNWFLEIIKTQIYKDLDTQLYIIFVGKNIEHYKKFIENIPPSETQENIKLILQMEVLDISKKILDKLVQYNQDLARNHSSIFNSAYHRPSEAVEFKRYDYYRGSTGASYKDQYNQGSTYGSSSNYNNNNSWSRASGEFDSNEDYINNNNNISNPNGSHKWGPSSAAAFEQNQPSYPNNQNRYSHGSINNYYPPNDREQGTSRDYKQRKHEQKSQSSRTGYNSNNMELQDQAEEGEHREISDKYSIGGVGESHGYSKYQKRPHKGSSYSSGYPQDYSNEKSRKPSDERYSSKRSGISNYIPYGYSESDNYNRGYGEQQRYRGQSGERSYRDSQDIRDREYYDYQYQTRESREYRESSQSYKYSSKDRREYYPAPSSNVGGSSLGMGGSRESHNREGDYRDASQEYKERHRETNQFAFTEVTDNQRENGGSAVTEKESLPNDQQSKITSNNNFMNTSDIKMEEPYKKEEFVQQQYQPQQNNQLNSNKINMNFQSNFKIEGNSIQQEKSIDQISQNMHNERINYIGKSGFSYQESQQPTQKQAIDVQIQEQLKVEQIAETVVESQENKKQKSGFSDVIIENPQVSYLNKNVNSMEACSFQGISNNQVGDDRMNAQDKDREREREQDRDRDRERERERDKDREKYRDQSYQKHSQKHKQDIDSEGMNIGYIQGYQDSYRGMRRSDQSYRPYNQYSYKTHSKCNTNYGQHGSSRWRGSRQHEFEQQGSRSRSRQNGPQISQAGGQLLLPNERNSSSRISPSYSPNRSSSRSSESSRSAHSRGEHSYDDRPHIFRNPQRKRRPHHRRKRDEKENFRYRSPSSMSSYYRNKGRYDHHSFRPGSNSSIQRSRSQENRGASRNGSSERYHKSHKRKESSQYRHYAGSRKGRDNHTGDLQSGGSVLNASASVSSKRDNNFDNPNMIPLNNLNPNNTSIYQRQVLQKHKQLNSLLYKKSQSPNPRNSSRNIPVPSIINPIQPPPQNNNNNSNFSSNPSTFSANLSVNNITANPNSNNSNILNNNINLSVANPNILGSNEFNTNTSIPTSNIVGNMVSLNGAPAAVSATTAQPYNSGYKETFKGSIRGPSHTREHESQYTKQHRHYKKGENSSSSRYSASSHSSSRGRENANNISRFSDARRGSPYDSNRRNRKHSRHRHHHHQSYHHHQQGESYGYQNSSRNYSRERSSKFSSPPKQILSSQSYKKPDMESPNDKNRDGNNNSSRYSNTFKTSKFSNVIIPNFENNNTSQQIEQRNFQNQSSGILQNNFTSGTAPGEITNNQMEAVGAGSFLQKGFSKSNYAVSSTSQVVPRQNESVSNYQFTSFQNQTNVNNTFRETSGKYLNQGIASSGSGYIINNGLLNKIDDKSGQNYIGFQKSELPKQSQQGFD